MNCFSNHYGDQNQTWRSITQVINVNRKDTNLPLHIIKDDGTNISDPRGISQSLNEYFVSIGCKLASSCANYPHISPVGYCRSSLNSFFITDTSEDEIYEIVRDMKTGKAEGHDRISTEILKTLIPAIGPILAYYFNQCIDLAIFPDALKIARITPVHKSGTKTDMSNYRPISVLSCIAILYEKLIYKRLVTFFERNSLISIS